MDIHALGIVGHEVVVDAADDAERGWADVYSVLGEHSLDSAHDDSQGSAIGQEFDEAVGLLSHNGLYSDFLAVSQIQDPCRSERVSLVVAVMGSDVEDDIRTNHSHELGVDLARKGLDRSLEYRSNRLVRQD